MRANSYCSARTRLSSELTRWKLRELSADGFPAPTVVSAGQNWGRPPGHQPAARGGADAPGITRSPLLLFYHPFFIPAADRPTGAGTSVPGHGLLARGRRFEVFHISFDPVACTGGRPSARRLTFAYHSTQEKGIPIMCGIFGYTGQPTDAATMVFAGLKKLEYRGYDSWGIAVGAHGTVHTARDVGKLGAAPMGCLPPGWPWAIPAGPPPARSPKPTPTPTATAPGASPWCITA